MAMRRAILVGRKSQSKALLCAKAARSKRPVPPPAGDDTEDDEAVAPQPKTGARRSGFKSADAAIPQVLDASKPYCFSSVCKGSCEHWLVRNLCHIPLIALSDKTARHLQSFFEKINASFRTSSKVQIAQRAQRAWQAHQDALRNMQPDVWPPLCAGPHHPSLYKSVVVDELGSRRLYRILKLPIPASMIKSVVSTSKHCGGVFLDTDRSRAKIQKLVGGYLTQDGTWKNNVVVKPITDPRHPAYRPDGSGYKLCALTSIKKGSIIGAPVYSGVLRPTNETDKLELDMDCRIRDRWAYSFRVSMVGELQDNDLDMLNNLSFDASSDSDDDGVEIVGSKPGEVKSDWFGGIDGIVDRRELQPVNDLPAGLSMWDIEGGQFCNELAKANDRKGFAQVLNLSRNEQLAPNVIVQSWTLYNLPCIMYLAAHNIQVGEELLLDYGAGYWARQEVMAWCRKENEALKEERARVLREKEATLERAARLEEEQSNTKLSLEKAILELEAARGTAQEQLAERSLSHLRKKLEANGTQITQLRTLLSKSDLVVKAVEQKNVELKMRCENYEYIARSKDTALSRILGDRALENTLNTLGQTVKTQVAQICVYSEIAELTGYGARHILSQRPERHYASCKFVQTPQIAAQVIVCERCGLRYKAGLYARARHAEVCELYIEAAQTQHQRGLEDASLYDNSAETGVQHHLGDLARNNALASLAEHDQLVSTYGTLSNYSILLTLLELITYNARLTRLWQVLLFSCFEGYAAAWSAPNEAEAFELIRVLCSKEYELHFATADEIRVLLTNNYELARLLISSQFRQVILPQLPSAFSWVVNFAEVFVKYCEELPRLQPDDVADCYVNDLKILVLAAGDKLDYLGYNETLPAAEGIKDEETRLEACKWTFNTDVSLRCTSLRDAVQEFYSQFKWPHRPMPRIPRPILARRIISSSKPESAQLTKEELPTKEEIIEVEEGLVKAAAMPDLSGLELLVSYFLLDEKAIAEYESVGELMRSSTFEQFDDDEPRVFLCAEVPAKTTLSPMIEEISLRSPSLSEWEPHAEWRALGVLGYSVHDCLVIGQPRRSISVVPPMALSMQLSWEISLLLHCNTEDVWLEPMLAQSSQDFDLNKTGYIHIVPLLGIGEREPLLAIGTDWERHTAQGSFWMLFDAEENALVRLEPAFFMETQEARSRSQRGAPAKKRRAVSTTSTLPVIDKLIRLTLLYTPGIGARLFEQTSNTTLTKRPIVISRQPDIRLTSIGYADLPNETRCVWSHAFKCPTVVAPLRQTKISLARADLRQCPVPPN